MTVLSAESGEVTPADPLYAYLQAAGFPAWAGVVAWGVMRITNEMRNISNKLDDHIILTERRLSRIEAKANLLGDIMAKRDNGYDCN